ncbi:MAG: hypothetical protein AB7F28_00780 [Candidatus Margulisiibacteriota bacterium]
MKTWFAAVPLIFILALGGCGKASESTTSTTSTTSYAGATTLSGYVIASAQDQSQVGITNPVSSISSLSSSKRLSQAFTKHLSDISTLSDGTAILYEIGSDGTVIPTGITANVVDGAYEFKNIADGKKYVVGIVKTGTDSSGAQNVLRMDTYVNVKSGETAVSANVSEKTRAIVDYVVEKVAKGNGNKFSGDLSDELTQKITDTINSKLSSGEIQRVSPVKPTTDATVNKDVFPAPDDTQKLIVEQLQNDDDLRKLAQQAALDSQVNATLTLDRAKQIIRSIFGGKSGGGSKDGSSVGVPPEFFIEQFATGYLNGVTVTIAEFAQAFNESLPEGELKSDYWSVANVKAEMLGVMNQDNSQLRKLYAFYDATATSDTTTMPAMRVIFPKNNRWTLPITESQTMTVPQAIAVMIQAGLLDGSSLPLMVRNEFFTHDGPVFDPFVLLKAINFVSIQTGRYYIVETSLVPVRAYRQVSDNNWQPTDALDSRVVLYAENASAAAARVVLEYPTSTGTQTVEYQRVSAGNNPQSIGNPQALRSSQSLVAISAFNAAQSKKALDNPFDVTWIISPYQNTGFSGDFTPTFVTDYISGTATIKVLDADNNVLTSTTVRILKPSIGLINWRNPRGMDMARVQATGWDDTFEMQTMDVDVDTDKAQPNLQWDTPTGTVPDGYFLAYAINLGLSAIKVDWNNNTFNPSGSWDSSGDNYKWKFIWSSWQDNRFIQGNSFQLKQQLARTVRDIGNNYETTYELNIMPVLVEQSSGRVVWQGAESRTSFKVGAATPWSIGLNGTVTFPSTLSSRVGVGQTGTWKVGLFKMGGSDAGVWSDYFFSAGAKTPVTGPSSQSMVYSLGSMESVLAGNRQSSYTLPTFTKTDSILSRNSSYRLVVWYDLVSSGQTDKIDVAFDGTGEFFEVMDGDIWADMMGVRLFSFGSNASYMLNDDTDHQTINITVGRYWR